MHRILLGKRVPTKPIRSKPSVFHAPRLPSWPSDKEDNYSDNSSKLRRVATQRGLPTEFAEDETIANSFQKWHGMSSVIDEIAVAVNSKRDRTVTNVNGWAVLAVVLGVDEVCKRLGDNLNFVVLVAGLLISTSLSLSTNMPVYISDNLDTSEWDAFKTGFFCSVVLAITFHFLALIMALLFGQAINTCARATDQWRLILTHGAIPTFVYMIFSAGNLLMCMAIMFSMYGSYGPVSYVFTLLFFVVAVSVNIYNRVSLLYNSHVVHGWYQRRFDAEYDIRIPFLHLKKLAAYDKEYREATLTAEDNDLP